MPDILQDFFVNASPESVFASMATCEGLNAWWTKTCTGAIGPGEEFVLGFGPDYVWTAKVVLFHANRELEIEFIFADIDWTGTRIVFLIDAETNGSRVSFRHSGWKAANEHFRVSNHCLALYLRLMRRYAEHGEVVPYEERLAA